MGKCPICRESDFLEMFVLGETTCPQYAGKLVLSNSRFKR